MNEKTGQGEFALIRRIRRMLAATPSSDLVVGPGDDCAAVRIAPGRLLLLTCDAVVEGRHFVRDRVRPRDVGRKLAAVNLSDVAAMGGTPGHALLSIVVPAGESEIWTEEIAAGAAEELARHGAVLVGGNLSGSDGGVVADLSLVGEVEEDRVVLRSGARPGDMILVTGNLGASAAGRKILDSGEGDRAQYEPLVLAHVRPVPRVREGRIVAGWGGANAMIDISDGLASDLGHICEESGVGAEVHLDDLPVSEETREAAGRFDVPVESLAIAGGEDYELLLTVPEDGEEELTALIGGETGTTLTRIGTITRPGEGIRWLDADGAEVRLPEKGWDHFV